MMKKLFIVAIASIVVLTSCEKVIDLEVKDADKRFVIDAQLSTANDSVIVYISETQPYLSTEDLTHINNATITLKDQNGTTFNIPYTGEQAYTLPVAANQNELYTLTVEFEDVTTKAESFLTSAVSLIEVASELNLEQEIIIRPKLLDPAGQSNYYRIRYLIDGIPMDEPENWILIEDANRDGQEIRPFIRNDEFESGQMIAIELMTMSKHQFDYYEGLINISDPSSFTYSVSAPANPINNWSDENILGYFTTYAIDTMHVLIP